MSYILIYLAFVVSYLFFFSIVAIFNRQSSRRNVETNVDFLFMIPAYKEDNVIIQTVQNILSQLDFGITDEIVVIADQLKKETVTELKRMKITVIEVFFDQSTKAKAINRALKALKLWGNDHDAVVLLDADNHLVEGFISKSKATFKDGKQIIQTHRIAKNLDSPMAVLDAISEEINNSIFRAGHQNVGLSSALIGSGLIMKYDLFEKYLQKIDVVSGFDKQLELDILQDKRRIHYLAEAFVLDEKVKNIEVFENQRTRWMSAQVSFAKANYVKAFKELFINQNLDFFNKVIQFFMPPRAILLAIVAISLLISILVEAYVFHFIFLNLTLWLALFIATPIRLLRLVRLNIFFELTRGIFSLCKATYNIRKAKQSFLHTPHGI